MKIELEERSQDRQYRLREFEDRDSSPWLENAPHLGQAPFDVGQVSQAEGNGHRVKLPFRKRKPQGVSLGEVGAVRGIFHLLMTKNQHWVTEIATNYLRVARQLDRQIGRPTAEIQRQRIWSLDQVSQLAHHQSPPPFVNVEGEEMVEPVIARRDLLEHRTNGSILSRHVELRVGSLVGHVTYPCRSLRDSTWVPPRHAPPGPSPVGFAQAGSGPSR